MVKFIHIIRCLIIKDHNVIEILFIDVIDFFSITPKYYFSINLIKDLDSFYDIKYNKKNGWTIF